MMEGDPCTVCGGTDVNLVDGFYYCIECGTQDMTIRETVVEATTLADGSFAVGKKKKISMKKPRLLMSKEWDKWHAYNFMLCGLVDELIGLGAKASFKSKVLWIWTRYIMKYHVRKEYDMNSSRKKNTLIKDVDEEISNDDLHKEGEENPEDNRRTSQHSGIRTMSYQLLYSVLYVGLNLDKSDILLSHLLRFIKEGRLSYHDIIKYIPSEINASKIPQWSEFMLSRCFLFTSFSLLRTSHKLIKNLDLGTPVIPDLKEIVNVQIKELCLPKDFKNLVLSIMEFIPIQFNKYMKFAKIFPDFETIVMTYVLLTLKLCFGLDDEYDIMLSDTVEEINNKENHLKCYRVGISEPTDRLFSMREWITFMEFRKIIICQLYQPMASKHDFNEDDFLVTELLKDQIKQENLKRVADQLSFELLNTIPQQLPFTIIPKEDFPVSLTPLTAYTEFVIPRIKDSQMRLLLSEDFSRYSLKYACISLFLKNTYGDNIIKGVTEDYKTYNSAIVGLYSETPLGTQKMVYVKNADNDNWAKEFLESKNKSQKKIKRKIKRHASGLISESSSDSDDDVPLSCLKTKLVKDATDITADVDQIKLETIEELEDGQNIFNDDFKDIKEEMPEENEDMPELVFEFSTSQINSLNATIEDFDTQGELDTISTQLTQPPDPFNPFGFNRQEVIKMLMLKACKKYKIPIPYKYNDRKPVKRKLEPTATPVFVRKRAKKAEYGRHTKIIAAYNALFSENTLFAADVQNNDNIENESTLNSTKNEICDEPALHESSHIEPPDIENNNLENEEYVNDPLLRHISILNKDVNSAVDNLQSNDFDFDFDKYVEDDKELMQILDKELFDFETDKSNKLKSLRENILDKKRINEEAEMKKNETITKVKQIRENYEPLIENVEHVNQFKYYTRHYKPTIMKNNFMSYTFESDLTANFPKSFKYILMTCASMLEVSPYHLYKYFIYLEKQLLKKVKM